MQRRHSQRGRDADPRHRLRQPPRQRRPQHQLHHRCANGGVTLALKTDDGDRVATTTQRLLTPADWRRRRGRFRCHGPNNVEPWNATVVRRWAGDAWKRRMEWLTGERGGSPSGSPIEATFRRQRLTCSAKLNGVCVPCSIVGAPSPTATQCQHQRLPVRHPTPTPTPPTPTPAPTPTTASPTPTHTGTTVGGVTTSVQVTTDWGTGYCTNVTVSTASAAAPITWSVKVPVARARCHRCGPQTTRWQTTPSPPRAGVECHP